MTKITQLSIYLVGSLLLLVGLTNCVPNQDINAKGDVTTLSISKGDVTFANTGGQEKITIETNSDAWDFFTNTTEEWLKVAKEGDNALISVSENKTADDRTATLVISANGVNKNISIKQSSADVIFTLSENNELVLPAQGGIKIVAVESNNASWRLEPLASEIEWLSIKGGNGQSDMLVIETTTNPSFEARTAEVIATLSNGTKKLISIKQIGTAKYLLPFDQDWREYSEYNLIQHEQARGSVMQQYAFPQKGDAFSSPKKGKIIFNTSSSVMPLLIYTTTIIDPKYEQSILKLIYKDTENRVEIDEYAAFLVKNNYEETPSRQPEKRRHFIRKDGKAIAIIDFDPAYGDFALVGFVPVYPQEQAYATFSVLPKGANGKVYDTVFNKKDKKLDDVLRLEKSLGSTEKARKMNDAPYDQEIENILFEPKANQQLKTEEENLRWYGFYHHTQSKIQFAPEYLGSVNEYILFFKEYTRAVYLKPKNSGWDVTEEFHKLLKKEGYSFLRNLNGTQLYLKEIKDAKEVLHVTFSNNINDPIMGGNPHVQIGYFQIPNEKEGSSAKPNFSSHKYPEYQFTRLKSGEYQLILIEGDNTSPLFQK